MTHPRRNFLALAGLGFVLGPRSAAAREAVRGSGVPATQHRDVGSFSGVAVGGPFAVVLRAASREAIEIVADDNLLPLVETTLHGSADDRSLHIELARDTRIEPRTRIVVTVDYVRLDSLAVGGAGSIDAKAMKAARLGAAIGGSGAIALVDLDAGDLAVAIGGSGSFRAEGRARSLKVQAAGSGRCDTERLAANDVTVSLAGSGDVRVRADAALRASIAGSGDVYHSGAATPQVAIAGSGRVKRM